MNKQLIGYIIIAIILITGTYFWKIKTTTKPTETNSPISSSTAIAGTPTKDGSDIVLYFGDTCPHCKVLEEFLQTNKVAEKVLFTEKEVYKNPVNAQELSSKAKQCGLATDSIGVPFVWDGSKCYVGGDATAFFKQKAGI